LPKEIPENPFASTPKPQNDFPRKNPQNPNVSIFSPVVTPLNAFGYSNAMASETNCHTLTGLTRSILCKLVKYVTKDYIHHASSAVSPEDQIVLTLCRLRQGTDFTLLGVTASIDKGTVGKYFARWIDILFVKLKPLIRMQDRKNIFKTLPHKFRERYPRLTSIIDCFEIFTETPGGPLAQGQMYSNYKSHCTVKVLISCTPLGAINFISVAWGGRATDVAIVKSSQFHTDIYHQPGDQILADRGFILVDDFKLMSNSELIIPSFLCGKAQLPDPEIASTRNIANIRIHIERVISRLRNTYTILSTEFPIKMLKTQAEEKRGDIICRIDKIVNVCATLVNMQKSVIVKAPNP